MAIPANSFTTYTAVGNREDLIDVITNISPVDTFVTSNTGSGRATARFHEWQTDVLAAAGENITIEGDSATTTAITPSVRTGNYTQILRKVWQITDTQEAVESAGRGSEVGYQQAKHLRELARDIEYALVINSSSASGATGTARKMNGMVGFISTTNTTGDGTALEALDESMLNDNLSAVWAQGGFPSTVLVGSFQKRKISNFSTNTRDVAASAKELTRAVDIYQSDFGTVTVRLHHQINTTIPGTVIVLGDMSLWQKSWLRPVNVTELAKVSSSKRFMVEAELTLESRQEKGSGKITLLTTS